MQRELAEYAQIGEALKDLGRLFGEVHFVEDGLVAEARRVQDLVGGLQGCKDSGPDGLFAKEVEGGLLSGRGGYRAAAGCSNAARNREGQVEGVAAYYVALYRDKAGVGFAADKAVAHASADHTRCDHHDIYGVGYGEQVEGHVVTGCHDQRSARLEERSDLLAKDMGLLFVGDEQEDDFAPGGGLRDA